LEEIKFAVSILAEGAGSVVGAGEPLESRQVEIYPNPAADMVMIEFSPDVGSDTDITLHDLNGRVLFAQKRANDSGGRNRVEIPVSVLPSGMYIVRLSTAGELFVKKLIKQ
jgi:hypothetical protein